MPKEVVEFVQLGSVVIIIIIIKALSQLCWDQVYEFCFTILIYLEANPWIGCISLNISLLLPSTSSLAQPFFLVDHQSV